MVIDVCTFNGEYELWDLHYNVLKDVVDQFIVVEAPTTFSGRAKPLYFKSIIGEYPGTSHFVIHEDYSPEELETAKNSPNTQGAAHWTHEFLQKESIKKALTHLDDNDTVFIGDVDEIWSPTCLFLSSLPIKLKLQVYTYYLNNRSSEQFWGTIMSPYYIVKDAVLNHLRTNAPKSNFIGGWHFTSMKDHLSRKLTDSYTQESYATPEVMRNLEYNIENNKDFLGRNFSYALDESDWPEFLKRNRKDYEHLTKQGI